MPGKGFLVSLLMLVTFLLFSNVTFAQNTGGSGVTDFLDTFATAEYPGAYGDVLEYFANKAKGAPDPVKAIYEDLDKYNKYVGRISGAIDILGKAGTGEYSEAAISAAMLGISEYAGSEAGKALLGVVGLSTISVNVAIAAVQTYRASVAELEKQTIGRQLEALYGRIESDPVLKNRNRTLGQGDPIPVNQGNIDYTWKKVMVDPTWRELFKVYVTSELEQEWPEPSTWEKWTLSSNVLEEDLLFKKKDEYKSYIAGLLSQLNRAAKVAEQLVLARQALTELRQKLGTLPDLASMLAKLDGARKRLPAAAELGAKCATYVQNAINTKSYNSLEDLMNQCKGFAENVLKYIPEKGTFGAERKAVFDQLKKCYDLAKGSFVKVAALQKQDLEKTAQSVPAPSGGYRFDAQRFPYTLEFGAVKDQVLKAFIAGQPELEKLIEAINKEYSDTSALKYQDFRNKAGGVYGKTKYGPMGQHLLDGAAEDALEAAYKSFNEKMNAYQSIDSTTFGTLMFQVKEYIDTLTQAARNDAGKTDPGPIWGKINAANVKKGAVLQAVNGVEKLPETGYVGLQKLTFPKPGPAEYGAKPYFMPYLEYVDKLALNARYRVTYSGPSSYSYGGEGRVGEINTVIQQIDAAIALVDGSGSLKADVKEIEDSIIGFRNLIKTSLLRQGDVTRLEKELQGMDASVKELKDFLGRTSGYKSMCTAKRNNCLTDISNIETDMSYLTQLKVMLEKTADILDGLNAKYRREPAAVYGVGAGGAVVVGGAGGGFVFKENTPATCEALLTKPSIMLKADIEKATGSVIASIERTGIFKTDKAYNIGIEQYARKAVTDYFAYGTASPDHYIFIPISTGQCIFSTKAHFEDLAAKVNALPGETSEGSVKAGLEKAAGESLVAKYLVGIGSVASLDKIDTKTLLDIANRSWDSDVKQGIVKFAAAVNNKIAGYKRYNDFTKQLDTLLAKLMAVETPAQGKTDAALWKKVTDMEPEILAFEKAVAGDSLLTADNKNNLKISIDSMKSRISMARSPIATGNMPGPGGGQMIPGQGQTGGPAGPGGVMTGPPQGMGQGSMPQGPGQTGMGQPGQQIASPMAPQAGQQMGAPSGMPQAQPPSGSPSGPGQMAMAPQSAGPGSMPPSAGPSSAGTMPTGMQGAPPQGAGQMPGQGSMAGAGPGSGPQGPQMGQAMAPQPAGAGSPQGSMAGPPKMAQSAGIQPGMGGTGASMKTPMTMAAMAQPKAPQTPAEDYTPQVKDLYNQFRRAYESKDLAGITGCISNQWQANDGTNLSALRSGLTKAFANFDEIKCTIQSLQVQKSADGKYKVSYDFTLSGKNAKKNLKQEEKSRVSEEVTIEGGKPKIMKTLSGRFWYGG